jgi:hypothetical protein
MKLTIFSLFLLLIFSACGVKGLPKPPLPTTPEQGDRISADSTKSNEDQEKKK